MAILKDKVKEKITGSDPKNTFTHAVNNGNIELINELIQYYPNLDYDKDSGTGNLVASVIFNSTYSKSIAYEIADCLLENGSDINAKDSYGASYIYTAIQDENYRAVKYYIDNGVDLNSDDDVLGMPLEYAVRRRFYSCEAMDIISILINNGAIISDEFYDNYNNFTYSARTTKLIMDSSNLKRENIKYNKYIFDAFNGDIEEALNLIKTANPTQEELEILNQFTQAFGTEEQLERLVTLSGGYLEKNITYYPYDVISCGNSEMLDYFLKNKLIDNYDMRLFDIAAYLKEYDIFDVLINNNFRMSEIAEIPYYTVLRSCISARDYNFDEFKKLYNYIESQYYTITENQAQAILPYCLDLESIKPFVDFLINEKGINFHAVCLDRVTFETAKYLYDNGRPLQAQDLPGAIASQDIEMIKLVLEKGADINQFYYDSNDCSELERNAADGEYIEYTNQVDSTSILNSSNRKSNFEVFINKVPSDIVKFLIDNGMEIPDNALELAVYASKATVKVLIDEGANTDLKFDILKPVDGVIAKKGDFDLKDYYIHYGREDLVELL